MKKLTFDVDYTFCPKGHGDWVHIPSSTMYSDIFWCEKCYLFYQPTVKEITYDELNESYSSDRAGGLVKLAKFLKWKSELNYKDYEKYNDKI